MATASLRHSEYVLDVGAGIQPQTLIKAKVHVCVEPHHEYVKWLREKGYYTLESTAIDVLSEMHDLDTVVMLDVIEHMEKDEGLEVIRLCKEKAKQIVIFTPLGFCKQSYKDGEKDAWGLNGMKWQTHRSGWEPSEVDGWEIHTDPAFHGERGGAFFAIWGGND